MSGMKPQAQERAHVRWRIKEQLQKHEMKTLFNKPFLRVWKAVPSKEEVEKLNEQLRKSKGLLCDADLARKVEAFPSADYSWYENPIRGDNCWSVIAPLKSRPYWESIKYNPNDFMSTGTYDFEIEEVFFNLNLTVCEAARFLQETPGDMGQVHVLRAMSEVVRATDASGQSVVIRGGLRHILMDPTEDTDELSTKTVGSRLVETVGSPYCGQPMREVPLEHVERMAKPFGFGYLDKQLELIGDLELERRRAETESARPQPPTVPRKDGDGELKQLPSSNFPVQAVPVTPENQCVAMAKTTGARCARKGTVEYDGKLYCTAHAPVTEERAAAAAKRGDY